MRVSHGVTFQTPGDHCSHVVVVGLQPSHGLPCFILEEAQNIYRLDSKQSAATVRSSSLLFIFWQDEALDRVDA